MAAPTFHLHPASASATHDALLGVRVDSNENVIVLERPEPTHLRLHTFSRSLEPLSSHSVRLDARLADVRSMRVLDMAHGDLGFHMATISAGLYYVTTFTADGAAVTNVSLTGAHAPFDWVDGLAVSSKTGLIYTSVSKTQAIRISGTVLVWARDGTYHGRMELAVNRLRTRGGHRSSALVLVERGTEEWLYVLDRGTRGLEVYNVTTNTVVCLIGRTGEEHVLPEPPQRPIATNQLLIAAFAVDRTNELLYLYDTATTQWYVSSLTGQSMRRLLQVSDRLDDRWRIRGEQAGCCQAVAERFIVIEEEIALPNRARVVINSSVGERRESEYMSAG